MSSFFDEDAVQIEPSSLLAFGIKITSRYGQSSEIIEMINFACEAAKENINGDIAELEYDSKQCMCNITLKDTSYGHKIDEKIIEIGNMTLSQFNWNERIYGCNIE